MRDFFRQHLYGILGTVIFHLLLILVFLMIKVSVTYKQMSDQIVISFESELLRQSESPEEEPSLPLPTDEQFWHNIAVNRARLSNEQFNLEEYVARVKEELLEGGDIDPENWQEDGDLANHLDMLEGEARIEVEPEEDPFDSTMAAMENAYSGPTTIYYELPGRFKTYLPLPIYKCPGGGKIVIRITVNPYGTVTDSTYDPALSESSDECLILSALQAARRSVFNKDIRAPEKLEGTITYIFQPQ